MKHDLRILPAGYGHWKIQTTYRGKVISCTTTDSMAIDDFNSEPDEKDGRQLRHRRGYNSLRDECIQKNK
jgi:hypothetical protein